ncbi:MAG: class I SAM-dependent methyltransferase [Pseudomonadota bacterium]
MRHLLLKALKSTAKRLGMQVIPADRGQVYLHTYEGGYDAYRARQIDANRQKLDRIWADDTTMDHVAGIARRAPVPPQRVLCHGSRNGWEVAALARRLRCAVTGTDISPTAAEFDGMVEWDFHEPNPDWTGQFDLVYSNSLDQAFDPRRAIGTWVDQLAPHGRFVIDHSVEHDVTHTSDMDPFGANPMAMPYLLFQWGRGRWRLDDIVEIERKANRAIPTWLFVVAPDRGATAT